MKSEELAAHTDLLTYVLQDYVHNRLTPRVVDIAYTAFMIAKRQNDEDGGPTDWFNDTKPTVMKAIDKLRKDLMEDRAKQSEQSIEPVAYRWRQPIVDNKGITVGYTDWIYGEQKGFLDWWPHELLYTAS